MHVIVMWTQVYHNQNAITVLKFSNCTIDDYEITFKVLIYVNFGYKLMNFRSVADAINTLCNAVKLQDLG